MWKSLWALVQLAKNRDVESEDGGGHYGQQWRVGDLQRFSCVSRYPSVCRRKERNGIEQQDWRSGQRVQNTVFDMVSLFFYSEEENQYLRTMCGVQIIIQRVCRLPEQDGAEKAGKLPNTMPAENLRNPAGILQPSVKRNRLGSGKRGLSAKLSSRSRCSSWATWRDTPTVTLSGNLFFSQVA